MSSRFPRVLRGLAIGIVAGPISLSAASPLPASQLKTLKAQEPQRTAQTLAFAQESIARLGLPAGTSLSVHNTLTSQEGRTVVRLRQTLNGYRVFGGGSIGHMDADGRMKLVSSSLLPATAPQGSPRLSPEQALSAAKAHLGLKGETLEPTIEQVVFPSDQTGGLQLKWDKYQQQLVLDRAASVTAKAPKAPYVWAYEVGLATWNRVDGITGMHLIIDGNTGQVLRKESDIHAQAATGTPVKGTGHSQYSGALTLDTMQAPDGTFALRDLTRGSRPHPYFHSMGIDITGLFTMYEAHEGGGLHSPLWGQNFWFEGKAANAWGDGQPFLGFPGEGSPNGETAAVDAQYGLSVTWDMYKHVFGRDGIDGKGTTPLAQVHVRDQSTGLNMDNAFWNAWTFGMFFGDGTYYEDSALKDADGTTIVIPGNPNGMKSLTELDVTAHELSHGLMSSTAALSYGGESGGMNEASSDIFGQLAEAYSTRPAGADTTIPATGGDWLVGAKCSPSGPLRDMRKPSRDFVSVDNWYNGIDWLDVHFSSGPLNRWFYFLAMGAPSSSTDAAYSPYLPGGMAGIGMDKAGRIWFKALTEYLQSLDTYHSAAKGVVSAAEELYGAGSAEVTAVKQAYRAINVQIEGEPLFTRVEIPVLQVGGVLGRNPKSLMAHTVILPMGTTVAPSAVAVNNPDPSVTWKVGGHLGDYSAPVGDDHSGVGVVNPDGTWTAPYKRGWFAMTYISKADPLQYTQGMVHVLNLDCDDDAEQDAVDMARSALSYWMPYNLKPNDSPYGGPWVDDMDAEFFQVAIRNAWGVTESQK